MSFIEQVYESQLKNYVGKKLLVTDSIAVFSLEDERKLQPEITVVIKDYFIAIFKLDGLITYEFDNYITLNKLKDISAESLYLKDTENRSKDEIWDSKYAKKIFSNLIELSLFNKNKLVRQEIKSDLDFIISNLNNTIKCRKTWSDVLYNFDTLFKKLFDNNTVLCLYNIGLKNYIRSIISYIILQKALSTI